MSSLGSSPIRKLGPPVSVTETFYAASSSGGATDVLNTVSIVNGEVTDWAQAFGAPGTPAGWQFNDAANSGHALLATFD